MFCSGWKPLPPNGCIVFVTRYCLPGSVLSVWYSGDYVPGYSEYSLPGCTSET